MGYLKNAGPNGCCTTCRPSPCDPCNQGPTGCCLYPAQDFADGSYSAADLPASLIVTASNGAIPVGLVLTKAGSQYTGGGWTLFTYQGPNAWILNGPNAPADQYLLPCLVGDFAASGSNTTATISDQFPDTYTLTIQNDDGSTLIRNLMRYDTCSYAVDSQGGTQGDLVYQNDAWYLFGDNRKSDPQSSPAGQYGSNYSVS